MIEVGDWVIHTSVPEYGAAQVIARRDNYHDIQWCAYGRSLRGNGVSYGNHVSEVHKLKLILKGDGTCRPS